MTLADYFAAPHQRTGPFDVEPRELHLPTHDRTEADPDFDEFDESHLIRGYD
ncbi:hypothetical protein [Saccharopolyspora phatthalungensis]|uniref:Uncharacterized protein n=1 Tax=Saccharopolyspora phatthalungensis TaxID=664693 RepID=A0A840QEQ0_9PSEU|nr:hypothetical protein [Saccharopolyspora phatthalungensis]MBB5158340.1 hypothetical protein [Saccharopolyspora phatthalungensis]